ncbi:MAG: hypothetical protein IPP47_27920 [Bryobacterales bacterium]|nr:hypothetical protein [Bryobacterales bacterium]
MSPARREQARALLASGGDRRDVRSKLSALRNAEYEEKLQALGPLRHSSRLWKNWLLFRQLTEEGKSDGR